MKLTVEKAPRKGQASSGKVLGTVEVAAGVSPPRPARHRRHPVGLLPGAGDLTPPAMAPAWRLRPMVAAHGSGRPLRRAVINVKSQRSSRDRGGLCLTNECTYLITTSYNTDYHYVHNS